ncbi:hypothetical protein B6F84_10690 [Acidianus manzaensis]|uniref:Uncharacterized protein n=1 Tax=Acidianus manzaensis TaxID=282676 RepID=A0A1W6K1S4_9CREN|nr:hypothetical protein B6F84_10690 [Acidianus manzaensis]
MRRYNVLNRTYPQNVCRGWSYYRYNFYHYVFSQKKVKRLEREIILEPQRWRYYRYIKCARSGGGALRELSELLGIFRGIADRLASILLRDETDGEQE